MASEVPVIDSNDFACVCSPESREEIRLVREWLKEITDGRLKDENLVSNVVYGLEHWSAAITGISTDMWAGISASTHDNEFSVFIQCDNIEDGFAYVYKAFYDHFGPDGYEYDIEKAKREREAGR